MITKGGIKETSSLSPSRDDVDILRKHVLNCPDLSRESSVVQAVLSCLEEEGRRRGGVRICESVPADEHDKGRSNGHERATGVVDERPATSGSDSTDSTSNAMVGKHGQKGRPTTKIGNKPLKIAVFTCRTLLIDLPLALLFASFLLIYSVQHIYSTYYTPLISAAKWDAERLKDEMTYYERSCDETDLTTHTLQDLILPPNVTTADATENMMIHGMSVIPRILSHDTARSLRRYIVQRNAQLKDTEAIVVSQGEQRLSFGISATEHPAVSEALGELSTHPTLRPLLQRLIGPNPAVSEITAITSYHGCVSQAWHPDVKPEGSALKYARTFRHSYSLFMPLQDTTADMGVTTFCPGTHYCANNLEDVCDSYEIPGSGDGTVPIGEKYDHDDDDDEEDDDEDDDHEEADIDDNYGNDNDDDYNADGGHLIKKPRTTSQEAATATTTTTTTAKGFWKMGDGALLNQQAWHRGYAHTNPHAPERVVFIVSFLSRPSLADDPRQLSHGTYFHIRWDMWGHTLNDLVDARRHMSHPFAALRSLGIWKPPDRQWGLDYLTTTIMRIANGEGGYEAEDLNYFVHEMGAFGLPFWLRGPVPDNHGDYSGNAWVMFIEGTLYRCLIFSAVVNVVIVVMYFGMLIILDVIRYYKQYATRDSSDVSPSRFTLFRGALIRIVFFHGFLAALAWFTLHHVATSKWASDIRSGRMLARPFPPVDQTRLDLSFPVMDGPTAFPERNDILFGIRYDSKFLASYNHWLDYHPGNVWFRNNIETKTNAYMSYGGLPPAFRNEIIQSVVRDAEDTGGRFLLQNSRGDWVIMPGYEQREYAKKALLMKNNELLHALVTELAFLIAEYRYGLLRGTVLARTSISFSSKLQEDLFSIAMPDSKVRVGSSAAPFHRESIPSEQAVLSFSPRRPVVAIHVPKTVRHPHRIASPPKNTPSDVRFGVGDKVLGNFEGSGEWFTAKISKVYNENFAYDLSYDDGFIEYGITAESIRPYPRYVEGDRIEVWFEEERTWFPGVITRVTASGTVDVDFDDSDRGRDVKLDLIRLLSEE